MATDDKQRIQDWCSADGDVRCVEEESDPGAVFTLVLESGGAELTAALPSGGDRIVLITIVDLGQAAPGGSGDLSADLAELEERRPGPVTARLTPTGEHVVISTWIVLDGLTKHSFLTAVSDLGRTRSAVLRLAGVAVTEAVMGEAAPETAAAEPAGGEGEVAEFAPSGVPAEQAATPAPTAWTWAPVSVSPVDTAAGETTETSTFEAEPEAELTAETPATEMEPGEEPVPETPVTEAEPGEEPVSEAPAVEAEPGEEPVSEAPVVEAEPGEEPVSEAPVIEAEPGEEPVSETSAASADEQMTAPSPWASPAATTFEPLPFSGRDYQPSAASAEYGTTPSPAETVGPFSAGGSGQGLGQGFTPAAATTPVPSPAPVQPVWTPDHRVPPQGMQAWAAPDPAGAVIATLGGHLPVQVTEVRGAWAHVVCSNGWTGWVDDRLLISGA
jgi:hypothetical protein